MTNNVGLGLPLDWKAGLIAWAKANSSIRELWLFGSRAKGTARVNSVVDLGLTFRPGRRRTDRAFENYVAHYSDWLTELEAIVQCHVSLAAMIPGNEGDEIIRLTGICLWERLTEVEGKRKPRRRGTDPTR